MEREKLGSRMGFILLSAGCAIGIGNVWRFPYVTGMYGEGLKIPKGIRVYVTYILPVLLVLLILQGWFG